ncbi:hypothetical protein ABZP36_035558 [Zizania latifolia]
MTHWKFGTWPHAWVPLRQRCMQAALLLHSRPHIHCPRGERGDVVTCWPFQRGLELELPGAGGGGVSVGVGVELVPLHAARHVSCSSSSHPEEASSSASSSASSITASSASLTAARASLLDTPVLYPFQELATATNNFLARRAPATAYWRCTLRGCDAALFQLCALRPDALRPKALAATARRQVPPHQPHGGWRGRRGERRRRQRRQGGGGGGVGGQSAEAEEAGGEGLWAVAGTGGGHLLLRGKEALVGRGPRERELGRWDGLQ